MTTSKALLVSATLIVSAVAAHAAVNLDGARQTLLQELAAQAKVDGFSAERGAALFTSTFKGGKPDTPSCTACHGPTPKSKGETRAGKPIEPLAVSATPDRFTDPEKVAKWFERNCNSVLGRDCTPLEKGDFITFMLTQ